LSLELLGSRGLVSLALVHEKLLEREEKFPQEARQGQELRLGTPELLLEKGNEDILSLVV